MFRTNAELLQGGEVSRYQIYREDSQLSYLDVLRLWRRDFLFREFFIGLLIESPFEAYRWETPPVTIKNVHQAFEFVLINSQSFVSRRTDEQSFKDFFTKENVDEGVVSFRNLGGDALLIVPSPRDESQAYGHLAAFVRQAPKQQVDALWRVVGETLSSEINDAPIWLSTAGGGVAWLHVRLDETPKYYGYAPYRLSSYVG